MNSRTLGVLIVCGIILGAGFFIGAPDAHAAFGISPPFLNADHLVPGATYAQTIYLVQDQPNEDLPVKATLSVPESIASWFTIDKGFNFVIPKGTRQFPVQVLVRIPSDQTLGKYSGTLAFSGAPVRSGQVSIALGASVAINLTIGTGTFEQFSIPVISFPAVEEGWNPQVAVKFQNDGNVPESFDSATFEILDQYGSVRLAYVQKNSGFPETKAFTTNEYVLEFPTDFHLGVGEYWGNVVFYQHQKVVASQKAIFHVLPAGSLSGVWGKISNYWKQNPWLTYLVIVLLVVLCGGVWRSLRRKNARK